MSQTQNPQRLPRRSPRGRGTAGTEIPAANLIEALDAADPERETSTTPGDTRSGQLQFAARVKPMSVPSVEAATELTETISGNNRLLQPGQVHQKPAAYLTQDCKLAIELRRMQYEGTMAIPEEVLAQNLEDMSAEEFQKFIWHLFKDDEAVGYSSEKTILDELRKVTLTHVQHAAVEKAVLKVLKHLRANPFRTAQAEKACVKNLIKQFRDRHDGMVEANKILDLVVADNHTETVGSFLAAILKRLTENRLKAKEMIERGLAEPPAERLPKRPREDDHQKHAKRDAPDAGGKKPATSDSFNACGRRGHKPEACEFLKQKHPDANRDYKTTTWSKSRPGIAWKKRDREVLPGYQTLSGASFDFERPESKKGKNILLSFKSTGHTLKCGIILNEKSPIRREVDAMVDTGSLTLNYVSLEVARWLTGHGGYTRKDKGAKRGLVCSVHECTLIDTLVKFKLVYLNNITHENESIELEAYVLKQSPYDLIIGRPTVEKYKLISDNKISLSGNEFKFEYNRDCNNSKDACCQECNADSQDNGKLQPEKKIRIEKPFFTPHTANEIHKELRKIATKQINETLTTLGKEIRDGRLQGAAQLHELATPAGPSDTVTAPLHYLYFLNDVDKEFLSTEFTRDSKYSIEQYLYLMHGERVSKDELLDPLFDDDTIDYSKDNIPWEQQNDGTEEKPFKFAENANPVHVKRVRELLQRYDDVFQATLNKKPAVLEPMVLKVNDAAWKVPRNRAPARFMSDLKREEVRRQVEKILELNLIRPSQSAEKSQVVLAKKPDGTWRFCIDYRELNTQTESMGWPIPNIPQMLQRIGMKKPKFFGVIDLTMGFFQAPLANESSKYTTFTTWMGTYEWLRVAMGLKGAPSWFQQQIETKVLGGLIHNICELYIDDIIIYANTYEEFLQNFEAVLKRLKEYNITISPKKCKLLMTEIEYVGYVIDTTGIRFSPEKKEKALNFPTPRTVGELKQFMGMAEYFHTHVRNFATLARPLHVLLKGYTKRTSTKKLIMSEEDTKSFHALQRAIDDSPTLFFPSSDREIFLETDACDYGIGAYLYQKDENGKQYPVAFISKNLSGSQLNWSTPEKEAFGIFYAIQKLEHLLRDVHFILKTDHKNLTYINFGNSAKIMRWKLMIQEYDFDIEHVAGEDNVVADAFSRLMAMPEDPDIAEILAHANVLKQVPPEQHTILSKYHSTNVGHFGEKITLKRLQEAGFTMKEWPEMKEHVHAFIRKCPCCQKMSVLKQAIEHHPFVIASYEPMQKVSVDTLGPIQKDAFGNTHVCVLTDCFSRFTLLIPTHDATANSAARALLQWFGLFGAPKELLSDMGTQFINKIIDELLELSHVKKLDILAGVHEQNSIVERRIKEVNRHIRDILFHTKVKENWSDALPLVQRIMNAQSLLPTGTSPAQIIFGNSINLDSGILLAAPDNQDKEDSPRRLSEWTAKMLKLQGDIIKVAQETQLKNHEAYFKRFTQKPTEFPINSYVLVSYGDKKPPTKFDSYWRGPFRVVSQDQDDKNRYTVQNLVTNKLQDFPVHQLKAYLENGYDKPEHVALTDTPKLHVVERIISHEGHRKNLASLLFKVKWEDLSEEETSMETHDTLKDTQPYHDYLNEIGGDWPALIPMEYTEEGEHYTKKYPTTKPSQSKTKKGKYKR